MLAIVIVVVLVVATATTTTTTTKTIIAQEPRCGVAYGPKTLGVDLTPGLISIDPLFHSECTSGSKLAHDVEMCALHANSRQYVQKCDCSVGFDVVVAYTSDIT